MTAEQGTRAASYFVAFAMGLWLVAYLFPLARLFPAHPYDQAFVGDQAAMVVGQRYFVADAWRWPLLTVPRLAAPRGTNIALTDSIPLAALLLKAMRAWPPPGAYVVDLWFAFACALQPLAAVFALRSAGERRLGPAAAAAAIAISLPTFLIRLLYHPALASHFLLLTGIGLYYRLLSPSCRACWLACPALLLVALLIHPYLLVMTACVLFAAPLTLCLRGDCRWQREALAVSLACVPATVAGIALGYGGTEPPALFGIFSMNLVAPVRPVLSHLWPVTSLDATGGQVIEGHQYLGSGLLLVAIAAAILEVWRPRRALPRPSGLAIVCTGMAMFALSNRVYAGHILLADIEPVPGLVRQFHASGRFFWPAAYAMVIWAVAKVARPLPRRWLIPVLGSAALLQFADAADLRWGMWAHEHTAEPWTAPRAALLPALRAATALRLWPTVECGADIVSTSPFMQVLLLASQTALPTNTMYQARTSQAVSCDEAAALGSPLLQGELLVVLPPAHEEHIPLVPGYPQTCRRRAPFTLCASSPHLLDGL